jgi:hypothetical protein
MAAVVGLGIADWASVGLERGAEVAVATVGDGAAEGDIETVGPQAATMTRLRSKARLFMARGTRLDR